jgi:aryl-alcohol dehydrogenase-like predicted oxidoreductase
MLIPNTDLRVSSICLGTATFGSEISADECFKMFDAFAATGGNFIDTARVYADWLPNGHGASEMTIGKWLSQRRDRDKFVLATKGGHPDLKTMSISRMNPKDVGDDIDESLRCLNTEYIDIYWLHRDDTSKPVEDILLMMEDFVKSGKIRFYGCSNWRAPRIAEALACARSMNLKGFVADQPLWSLADFNPGAIGDPTLVAMSPELFELHKRTGLAAICYSSQAKGFFTKVARDGENIKPAMKRRYWNDVNLARAGIVAALADELNVPIAAIPIAWLSSQPFVTIPIIGPRRMEQLSESLTAADLLLSREMVERLRLAE